MKLKTLNDIPVREFNPKRLRQEAIKWAKKGRKNLKKFNDREYELIEFAISRFIKDFFNLTEEDI